MSSTRNDQFRERVRVRLAVLGVNQSELCREHGASPSQFSNWLERGPTNLLVSTLDRMAEMLAVKPGWLLDGDLREAVPEAHDHEGGF